VLEWTLNGTVGRSQRSPSHDSVLAFDQLSNNTMIPQIPIFVFIFHD